MSPQTFKHFRILELLGKGGMGEVYLALDTTLERKVALKFLPRDLLRDPSAQGRLLDEARSASRVQHRNIATVHSIEEDGGIFALCMEYVDGATLKQLIAKGPLSLNQIARVGADIAAGMHEAHEQGMVHRDIKPANVMISRRGEVKVMDFGLAVRPERVVNTLGPNTYGTVQYMSPEQAQGQKLGPASDIFSLGSLLYEIITGRPPFNAPNDLAILQAIINTQPEPLRELRRDVPPALEQVVRGCLAKMPEQRWASMKDVSAELQFVEPTVEAGPRDLISELSSGLSDQGTAGHHRPDNAGRVGRRSSAPSVTTPDATPLDSVTPDLPEGVVVHEVLERPSAGRSGSGRVATGGFSGPASDRHRDSAGSKGAPAGMVLGPEVALDDTSKGSSERFVVQSTNEQWQERTRGDSRALERSLPTRDEEIAAAAARRARHSRPHQPVETPDRAKVIEEPAGERAVRDLQDLSDVRARRVRTRARRSSPLTLILPALIALVLVAAAGYGLLARVGVVPPIAEVLKPRIDEVLSDRHLQPNVDGAAVGAEGPDVDRPAETVADEPKASDVDRRAEKAAEMLQLNVLEQTRSTLSAIDSTRAEAYRAVGDSSLRR